MVKKNDGFILPRRPPCFTSGKRRLKPCLASTMPSRDTCRTSSPQSRWVDDALPKIQIFSSVFMTDPIPAGPARPIGANNRSATKRAGWQGSAGQHWQVGETKWLNSSTNRTNVEWFEFDLGVWIFWLVPWGKLNFFQEWFGWPSKNSISAKPSSGLVYRPNESNQV